MDATLESSVCWSWMVAPWRQLPFELWAKTAMPGHPRYRMQEGAPLLARWPACPWGCVGFLGALERPIGKNPACIYVAMENRFPQVLHTHQPRRMSVKVSQSGHLGPWNHHVVSPKVPPVPRAVWCLNDRESPIRGGGLDCIPPPPFNPALCGLRPS